VNSRRIIWLGIWIVLLAIAGIGAPSLRAEAQPRALFSNSTIYLPFVMRAISNNGPTLGGCPMLPVNNVWNARIDTLPIDTQSDTYVNFIGYNTGLHPDFGADWNGGPFGIPYVTVPGTQTPVAINYTAYGDESDPGPFPIPRNAPIEGGAASDGDRHVLVIDLGHCVLYELYRAFPQSDGSWNAESGAKFDLSSNALRPATWTSADAAGLPMLPGLVRYDEVASGEIKHAIRFTIHSTAGYIWPARHKTASPSSGVPPMGQRFRLKSNVDISSYAQPIQVIFTAFKRYGIIVADNGADWYIGGAPDARWNDGMLVNAFRQLHGHDFEAVDESSLMLNSDSGQVR
jgi:hypothetical protein